MTLTRGARLTGAALCAALAALAAAWIVRDFRAVDDPLALRWSWAGGGPPPGRQVTTTLHDPVLLIGYVVAGIAALRASVAPSVLLTASVVTFAVRLPALWMVAATWMDLRATDELRSRALLCTFAVLGMAAALLITAVAGRRPAHRTDLPARPSRRAAATAFLLLASAAAVRAAWEVYWTTEIPARAYLDRFSGSASLPMPLLGTPPGWLSAVLVLIALAAAAGALFRGVHSRPLGLAAAGLLTASGAAGLSLMIRADLPSRLGELAVPEQLAVASLLFECAAGAVTLLVLARRGAGDGSGGALPQVQRPAVHGPPPPSSLPPGW
ncbi:hypothetical protein [Streptomyces sp. NPDC000410]|uniref:hypothetical protein n=1 Tax=Streptomyces sp. NPDC000410 TaxID=3154254 RepID=UPI003332304E